MTYSFSSQLDDLLVNMITDAVKTYAELTHSEVEYLVHGLPIWILRQHLNHRTHTLRIEAISIHGDELLTFSPDAFIDDAYFERGFKFLRRTTALSADILESRRIVNISEFRSDPSPSDRLFREIVSAMASSTRLRLDSVEEPSLFNTSTTRWYSTPFSGEKDDDWRRPRTFAGDRDSGIDGFALQDNDHVLLVSDTNDFEIATTYSAAGLRSNELCYFAVRSDTSLEEVRIRLMDLVDQKQMSNLLLTSEEPPRSYKYDWERRERPTWSAALDHLTSLRGEAHINRHTGYRFTIHDTSTWLRRAQNPRTCLLGEVPMIAFLYQNCAPLPLTALCCFKAEDIQLKSKYMSIEEIVFSLLMTHTRVIFHSGNETRFDNEARESIMEYFGLSQAKFIRSLFD